MEDDDFLGDIEELAEELLLQEGEVPDSAGIGCRVCGWETQVPWALRERLENLAMEHTIEAHPEVLSVALEDDDQDA